MSLKLPTGSLADQVHKGRLEFRKFAIYVQKFMVTIQQRIRDVQQSFAEGLLNHEIRIKELETKLAVTPKQEIQAELENLIVETSEESNRMEALHKQALEQEVTAPTIESEKTDEPEKPVIENKVKFHKEY